MWQNTKLVFLNNSDDCLCLQNAAKIESERKIPTVPAHHPPSPSFILAKIKFVESYSAHQKIWLSNI